MPTTNKNSASTNERSIDGATAGNYTPTLA